MSIIQYLIRADLRRLILLVTIGSVLITLGNSYLAIYNEQEKLMIDTTLESNRRYAAKISESAEIMLESAQKQIAYSSTLLSELRMNSSSVQQEVHRLVNQSDLFNSAIVINRHAEVVDVWPDNILEQGMVLPESARQSFYAQKPMITDPFHSVTGNTLISVSHPIWGDGGEYLGYISGTIYLNQNGSLARLMRDHFFADDTYLYVVDRHGELIFHADENRVGENVSYMAFIQQVAAGLGGARELVNSKGIEMLAGYAPMETAQWGIVVQRPKQLVMNSIQEQVLKVFWRSLPIALLTLFGIWILALLIARPLRQLAKSVVNINNEKAQQEIVDIKAWYYEAAQLKMATLHSIGLLNERINELNTDSQTDPMTKLFNRRGMQRLIDTFEENQQQFSILALDIDHFKQVNDRYGHDTGDQVIQTLAQTMAEFLEDSSLLCRVGGEEFLAFLPNTLCDRAIDIAQSLCEKVSVTDMPKVKSITISIGVSCVHGVANKRDIDVAIKQADTALYDAKNAGRNCVRAAVYSIKP